MGREGKEKSRGQEFSDCGTPPGGGDQRENRKKGGVAVAEKCQGRDAKTLRRPLGQSEEGRRAGGTFSAHQHPGGLGPRRRSRRGRPAEGGGLRAGGGSCPGAVRGAALPRSDASWVPERPLLRWPLSP